MGNRRDLSDIPINEQIEQYFIEYKSKGAKRKFTSLDRYVQYYKKAEDICRMLDAPAKDYVACLFEGENPDKVLPIFLQSDKMYEKYEEYKKKKKTCELTKRYELNKEWLNEQLKKGFNEEDILLTRFIHFDAWFRVCYPKKYSEKIAKVWLEEAKESKSRELIELLINNQMNPSRIL